MLEFVEGIEQRIPGDDSTHLQDRLFIYGLVRALKPDICVEVGTHKGLTALYIAHALYDNRHGRLITCDPLDHHQEEYIGMFPTLKPYITYLKKMGKDLKVEGGVDFLFVDGFHQKEHVLAEIENLFPQLSDKAVVLFHDCGGDNEMVGVNAAVEEAGLKTVLLPTEGRMRIYSNFKL